MPFSRNVLHASEAEYRPIKMLEKTINRSSLLVVDGSYTDDNDGI